MKRNIAHIRQNLWDLAVQHCGSADAALDIAQLNGIMPTGCPTDESDYQVPEPANRKVVRYYAEHDIQPATQPWCGIPFNHSWSDPTCVEVADCHCFSWDEPVCVQKEPYLFNWNEWVCAQEAGWEFAWSQPECAETSVSYGFSWTNPFCEQAGPPYNFIWSGGVCVQNEGPFAFSWTYGVCVESAGSYSFNWSSGVCSERMSEWPEWETI